MTSERRPPLALPAALLVLTTRAKLSHGRLTTWEVVTAETHHSKNTVLDVWRWFKDLDWEQAKGLVGSSEEILRLRPDYIERKIEEAQQQARPQPRGHDPWEALVQQEFESKGFALIGQMAASELDKQAPRIFSTFAYRDIGLKALSDAFFVCLGNRFNTWAGGPLKDAQMFSERRRVIQEQILNDAKDGCESLGFVKLTDNFPLAAYHFFARGDETWLEDDCLQVVELGPIDRGSRYLECPLRPDYCYSLQGWDCRSFMCPVHELPLVEGTGIMSPSERLHIDLATQMWLYQELYQESVVTIEDVARKYPSKGGLSLRIPKLLPFSEVVIAVGELPTMDELKCLLQDFLRSSSALKEKVRMNEAELQRSWAKLLEALRSAPPAHPE